MDDQTKFVKSLSPKDRARIAETVAKILAGNLDDLDIKKLKGYEDLFRVRVGAFRIICERRPVHGFVILEVTRKNDTTYNL